MHNLNALKRLVKKVTGTDSEAKSIRGAIDEIANGYDPTTVVSKLSELTNDVGFITESDIPVAANQAASTAEDVAGLVTDLNALIAKLKEAGLMSADS